MNAFQHVVAVATLIAATVSVKPAQPAMPHVVQAASPASCAANFYPIDMATQIEFSVSSEISNASGTPCGQIVQPGY